jgi:hypothetical protein
MGGVPNSLAWLFMAWGAVTAVLIVLVIYGNTLDTRETEEIYINKEEEKMMGSEQPALVAKMERLKRVIISLAVVSGILLLASASVWAWIGWTRS